MEKITRSYVEKAADKLIDPMSDPEEKLKRKIRYEESLAQDKTNIDWKEANLYDQRVKDFMLNKPGAISIKEAARLFHVNNTGRQIVSGHGKESCEPKVITDKEVTRQEWQERQKSKYNY